jgi:hypothetical protein
MLKFVNLGTHDRNDALEVVGIRRVMHSRVSQEIRSRLELLLIQSIGTCLADSAFWSSGF